MLLAKYNKFYEELKPIIPELRLITDPLRTLAYGTDASFYRLIPKIVIKADTEKEVALILKTADRHDIPVTFRAAGTSLCGQAISDSVLVIAGSSWKTFEILNNGDLIRLARQTSGNRIPLWSRYMPRGVDAPAGNTVRHSAPLQVVYFPSCISRTMGPAKGDPDKEPLHEVTLRVLQKAGYDIIYPENMKWNLQINSGRLPRHVPKR